MSDEKSKNTDSKEFVGLVGTFTKYGTLLVAPTCVGLTCRSRLGAMNLLATSGN